MLLLPHERKQKISFEAKVILIAFAVVVAAMLFRNASQFDIVVRLQGENHGTREALQNLNKQFVAKESELARQRAEKVKAATAVRTIASVSHSEQKPQE